MTTDKITGTAILFALCVGIIFLGVLAIIKIHKYGSYMAGPKPPIPPGALKSKGIPRMPNPPPPPGSNEQQKENWKTFVREQELIHHFRDKR